MEKKKTKEEIMLTITPKKLENFVVELLTYFNQDKRIEKKLRKLIDLNFDVIKIPI